ncbi:YciI family protein [Amycolatopsis aidingensis]|uniref:YciI family protein n=1 Tax=Amycolatopsis aidingensis TaxID=2842453 RepID=UPI001C0B9CA9|nr:YciI family protein [Amycolatopsis aidingensis]
MKYLILIYSNPKTWGHPIFERTPEFQALPEGEQAALSEQAEELRQEIIESGEFVAGTALADPILARTVRVRDGLPVATDGPYSETKEQLAGYFVVDCASPERAAEIAGRFPDARFAGVEVRPIMETAGQEM